ncbi:uncharacterized protein BHQ10_008033 [Talaromyces amestolkiae]|uniref:Uncharacterized protein n=1 Tax=Talaromyces amestolkiae TaxID=1196081 RepID=A0A364L8J7_TALAM|nr:uncharacterized protein BHQ10_008033 [Talaromyces amestolkiae]RAO72021.1 hypothetical protein BHQ10_008033 [Talaromyces amestolkiae]
MHAWEQEGISSPDIQTIGKALGGGFVPLSGVLVHEKIFGVIEARSGRLLHEHTFQAQPVACAAAVQVQRIFQRDNLLDNVQKMGSILGAQLHQHIAPRPFVGNVRGRGLFWDVEFMQDPANMVPFPVGTQFCARVLELCLELGLSILGNLGVTSKVYVDHRSDVSSDFTVCLILKCDLYLPG